MVSAFLKLEKTNNAKRVFVGAVCGWLAANNSGLCPGFAVVALKPQNNNMSGKAWERPGRVRKAIKKLAVDLLKLYAARSQQTGFAYRGYALQGGTRGLPPYQATTEAQGGTG